MRTTKVITAVESHTEGMPTRVVTGGIGVLPGETMAERRLHVMNELESLRGLLMDEPRGHAAMSGALLQPSTRPEADWGVVFIEAGGVHPMCGHGTIGVVTVLIETGMVTAEEGDVRVVLDTPAGLVEAHASVAEGKVVRVQLRNVASFVLARDQVIDVPEVGSVRFDLAYGGNFYPVVELAQLGLPFEVASAPAMLDVAARIMDAINAGPRPVHPDDPSIAGVLHVALVGPDGDGVDGRTAVANRTGYLDRSPCGTGTSARMALLHARGELPLDRDFVNGSLLGSSFTGRLIASTEVAGIPAVIPTVAGRAWITGFSQHVLDPSDPFPQGFKL